MHNHDLSKKLTGRTTGAFSMHGLLEECFFRVKIMYTDPMKQRTSTAGSRFFILGSCRTESLAHYFFRIGIIVAKCDRAVKKIRVKLFCWMKLKKFTQIRV
ncbi:MAG: hypothetical protein D3924_05675 [Candidatus Electrothrix sp. AR4]|nr:hypothetical protein [Candidatus Electrothrix sp. AR4]